jgi:hypothetical protein
MPPFGSAEGINTVPFELPGRLADHLVAVGKFP